MPRPRFTKGDVERAVRGAIAGGMKVGTFAIHIEGEVITVVPWFDGSAGEEEDPASRDAWDCRLALRRAAETLRAADLDRAFARRASITRLEASLLLQLSDRLIRTAVEADLLKRQSERGAVRFTRYEVEKALGWR